MYNPKYVNMSDNELIALIATLAGNSADSEEATRELFYRQNCT